jgi:hypothetical protein
VDGPYLDPHDEPKTKPSPLPDRPTIHEKRRIELTVSYTVPWDVVERLVGIYVRRNFPEYRRKGLVLAFDRNELGVIVEGTRIDT